jgi:cytoskeleton protein RodZ
MNENRAMSNNEPSDASTGQDVKPESGAAVFTERHPNLTLLESGQNPGEILRAAREKAGYSLSDISTQTKINVRQLEAIESGDVGRLPPETFAKAFIKSYCKALKMDAAPIILSFGYSEVGAQAKAVRAGHVDAGRVEPLEPKMPSSSKRLSTLNFDRKTGKKSLSYGIVLAAVAVMAVFYIPVFLSTQTEEITIEEAIDPNEAPVASMGADQQATDGLPLPLNMPSNAGEAPIFPALQPSTELAELGSPNASTSPANSGLPAAPANSASTNAAPAVVAPSAPLGSTPAAPVSPATQAPAQSLNAPATSATALAASPTSSPATTVPAGPQGALRFNFQEQSWVTVRDANDKVLISQLNEAGSNLEVRGQTPFKLIVGNAKAVKVTSNGKAVDLNTNISGEVARVTVR